jgi:hypothetical protein
MGAAIATQLFSRISSQHFGAAHHRMRWAWAAIIPIVA